MRERAHVSRPCTFDLDSEGVLWRWFIATCVATRGNPAVLG
jgi:hypothetical protein